jgi:hypothetical protein
VMRHGHKKQVTSEAIKKMLLDNHNEQQALLEMATRRGGRGRRTRKKTISDMTGMLNSIGQDELVKIAVAAASPASPLEPRSEHLSRASVGGGSDRSMGRAVVLEGVPTVPEVELVDPQMREPTVPGNFLKTTDPFGVIGQSDLPLDGSFSRLQTAKLLSVLESEDAEPGEGPGMIILPSGDTVDANGNIVPANGADMISAIDPQMREPTVPGNFHKTNDPFGVNGQYGNGSLNLKRHSYTPT